MRPYLLAPQQNIVPLRDVRLDAPLTEEGARDQVQVVPSIVSLAGREKGTV